MKMSIGSCCSCPCFAYKPNGFPMCWLDEDLNAGFFDALYDVHPSCPLKQTTITLVYDRGDVL